MTKTNIIKSTVKYYSTHPRGQNKQGNLCVYVSDEGAMCAVGRCLNKQGCYELLESCESVRELDDLDALLRQPFRGHDYTFWESLQGFHDTNVNWIPNGKGGFKLTLEGKYAEAKLLKQYKGR